MHNTIKRASVVCCVAVTVLCASAVGYQLNRVQLANSIEDQIDQLALCPPNDVPELEWLILVYWTHNLHCASILHTNQSLSSLRSLNKDLDEMLNGNLDRESINVLWSHYAAVSRGGANYKLRFQPQRDEAIEGAITHGDAYFDRSSYYDFLEHVKAQNR